MKVRPIIKWSPAWTTQEIEILTNHADLSAQRIQEILDDNDYQRTTLSIKAKLRKLGLHTTPKKKLRHEPCDNSLPTAGPFTCLELSRAFGEPPQTIRRWIRKGWMKSESRAIKAQQQDHTLATQHRGNRYVIPHNSLRTFLHTWPELIDLHNINHPWLIKVLQQEIARPEH